MENAKKLPGYILLESVLAMIALSMISVGFFTIFSGQFSTMSSLRDALQAQQYAEIDAQKLRLMNYYDLENDGAKSRSAMTSWSNPGNVWEDEITVGNEISVSDYTDSKQRIATIKIYRNGDTLPRFSMEVPISSQTSGSPVGSVIAWAGEENPSADGGIYLECDGSTFDTSKYKRLYEVLGTNKLPDYRGVFLRGYGSRTHSQVNSGPNLGETETTHTSGALGIVQGDSIRSTRGTLFYQQFDEAIDAPFSRWIESGTDLRGNLFFAVSHKSPDSFHPDYSLLASYPSISAFEPTLYQESTEHSYGWKEALTKYRYSLSGNSEDGYTLHEEEIHPSLTYGRAGTVVDYDFSRIFPTDNEIRPVNVAVKFLIKAK